MYVDAGQLQGEAEGVSNVFEMPEDGNIIMNMFFLGEDDNLTEVTIFLVRADA